ncbi:class I SAM-dependent methyltransferase [Caproiciproducens sp. MSJ-32]|uniref:class I SAM-dependent methyltransferase n=1 Tax=Caproiciproducens sp. MSJ-32 TaxID=2841527 RepID=UPI001C12084E|nr:class I SAM-dependent methyltransferase [Caproiciproducens sp. MSJ-32]MBU5455399.1 class I SAM-dependent methyltransferase [Caproiciproducens sp. MSJ-32]
MEYNRIYKEIGFKTEIERLKKQAYLGHKKEIRMLKMLGLKDKSNILEVGCGPGFYTKILLKAFPNSNITSSDKDENFLRYADKSFDDSYIERLAFVKDDITKSSLPDEYFDFVIARFVFQHLDKPVEALKEIHRLLRPGGKVFIIDVDSDLWGTSFPKNNAIETINKNIGELQSRLNGNRKIGSALVSLLKGVGFRKLDIEAVVNHSDILGKENFRTKINEELIKDNRIALLMKEYNKFFDLDYSSIMILKLVICGEK